MESNNPFMRNVITALHMVLLTSMYLCLHLIMDKFGIIWDYKNADTDCIQKVISNFD